MNTRDVDIFGYSLGGSVSEMMNPVKRRLPELTPAQIANLTASLAPGAASLDIAGKFPQFPTGQMTTEEMLAGPRAPSLAENLAEGEYLSGIMQALGGLGDAASVIPAVGPFIGSVLKTPRALQRLQRAKEAGFDTDTVYYHATDRFEGDPRLSERFQNSGLDFSQLKPSAKGKLGPGIYMSADPAYTEKYIRTTYQSGTKDPVFGGGARILPIFVRGKIATRDVFDEAVEKAGDLLKKEFEEIDAAAKNNEFDELMANRQRFAMQKQKAQEIMAEDGFSGFKVGDEVVVFDPKNVRSVNAEFEDLESPELLKASGGAVSKFAEGGIAELLEQRSRFEDPLERLTQPIRADLGPLQMAIAQEEGLRQRAERSLAGLMGDGREDFRRAEKALMAADVLPVLGDVGAAADVRDALSEDDLLGAGIAAISFLPVVGGMASKAFRGSADSIGPKSLDRQRGSIGERLDPDLQFLMNTTPAALKRAEEVGGFPMPSLAVTRQDLPFESFGEITLVGAPTKFDPGKIKANVVFNADAYTVRAPQPFRIAKKDADLDFQQKYKPLQKQFDLPGADEATYELGQQELKKTATGASFNKVKDFLKRDPVANIAFLRDQGDSRPIPTSKRVTRRDPFTGAPPREIELVDKPKLKDMVDEYGAARDAWTEQELNKYFQIEKVFDASKNRDYYTGQGRVFKPYTGEEIVKFMKKNRGAAQEGGIFTSSTGALRASLTERLGSLKKIREQSARLVGNPEFTKFKDDSEEVISKLVESLEPHYKYSARGSDLRGEVIEMLIESERRSLPRALDEFGFEEVPNYVLDDIQEVKSYFRNAPTEYFEAKPQRLVDLSEFEGAIVPKDTPAGILKAFQDAGIQVEYYTDNAERLAARKKFAGTAFSVAGGITLIGAQTQQEDFDMNLGIGSI